MAQVNTQNQILEQPKAKNSIYRASPPIILEKLVKSALDSLASDIHIESRQNDVIIRNRIDGLLQSGAQISLNIKNGLISHIKVLAELDIAEKRRPQDGKIRYRLDNRDFDIRVSSVPTLYGEKIVLRLLDPESQKNTMDQLGMELDQKKMLFGSMDYKQGIILVTGPTGSGKTTTIYTMLNKLNSPQLNIMTVEDPVEYEILGINQTKVQPAINYTFANALRSFLRQDPDIIFIGEIRDTETAQISIRASLTGHLVLSTVHTNNALDTIARLMDMGVEPYLLAATLKLIIAQRLVRVICRACNGKLKNGNCKLCCGTGFFGREGIFEFLPVTDAIQSHIHDRSSMKQIRELKEIQSMVTLEKAGMEKCKKGITTIEEVRRVIE